MSNLTRHRIGTGADIARATLERPKLPTYEGPPGREISNDIPSHGTKPTKVKMAEATAKKESLQYTGTYVKGIGQMHKSNAIPVVDPEHAVAIAKMRRG